MNYHKVKTDFWINAAKRSWDLKTSYLLLFLMTSHHRNAEGLFWLPKEYISHELSLEPEEVEKNLKILIDEDIICYDEESSCVLIKDALKNNKPKSKSHQKAALRKLEVLPINHLFFDFFELAAEHCPSFLDSILRSFSGRRIKKIIEAKSRKESAPVEEIMSRFRNRIAEITVEAANK